MFYSGSLVCPALLSLRAGTWPLMLSRLMCSRGVARRDLLILEIELGQVGSREEASAVQVGAEQWRVGPEIHQKWPCRTDWVRRRKESGRQVIGSVSVEDE